MGKPISVSMLPERWHHCDRSERVEDCAIVEGPNCRVARCDAQVEVVVGDTGVLAMGLPADSGEY